MFPSRSRGFGFMRIDLKEVAKIAVVIFAGIIEVEAVKMKEVMAARIEVGKAAIGEAGRAGLLVMALAGRGIEQAEGLVISCFLKIEGPCNLEAETWAHLKIIRARGRSRTELFKGKRFSESCLSLSHFESWPKVNSNS